MCSQVYSKLLFPDFKSIPQLKQQRQTTQHSMFSGDSDQCYIPVANEMIKCSKPCECEAHNII